MALHSLCYKVAALAEVVPSLTIIFSNIRHFRNLNIRPYTLTIQASWGEVGSRSQQPPGVDQEMEWSGNPSLLPLLITFILMLLRKEVLIMAVRKQIKMRGFTQIEGLTRINII